jgi:hypothetical protein
MNYQKSFNLIIPVIAIGTFIVLKKPIYNFYLGLHKKYYAFFPKNVIYGIQAEDVSYIYKCSLCHKEYNHGICSFCWISIKK